MLSHELLRMLQNLWAQLHTDDRKFHGMGVVDWISSEIGLIIGPYLDRR
jgi:hypothetical protein